MVELAEILRHAGPAYRNTFGRRMLPSHLRAMEDIALCRTPALGGSLYRCDDCGTLDFAYHSCRNRHCPKCQQGRAELWLERLRSRLLPCTYSLLTFTLPAELRSLARSHQREIYAILLREAAAAAQSLADDRAWIGGRLGILAVLHTWSRALAYHPHAHLLVTAGALSPSGRAWIKPAHARFLFPGYALSAIFRAKVRDAFRRAGLDLAVDPAVWAKPWTVHIKSVGTGEKAALYLSRYVYRVALTNQRIESFDDGRVTFSYIHARSHQPRRLTFPVETFISRFLQHVLPRGFTKIRYYGLFSPTCHEDLEQARLLLADTTRRTTPSPETRPPAARPAPAFESAGPAHPPRLSASDIDRAPALRICPACHRGHLHRLGTSLRGRAPPA